VGPFAGVIQEVMCDPDITVAIFSVTRPIAAKFLHQIKEEFEQNLTLKLAYPDVLFEFFLAMSSPIQKRENL
jgi:hypothetical protein